MSSRNPSTMLAESLADFSKAAYQVFTEIETQARQEVAHAVAETRDTRAERDRAMKDLRAIQLESQSWKEDAASSRAALTQAEMTIAQQADNLVTQLETIAQLRRELNQWKDQARNWQEHFLRVEEERCSQSSRIDEFIMQKLEKFQYAARPGTSASAFVTPKTSKQLNHVNSAPSSVMTKQPASPRPPAYRPNAESATPEDAKNGTFVPANHANSANPSKPLPTSESSSRRPKPKSQTSQHHGLKEGVALPGTFEKLPNGRKPRKSNGDNHTSENVSAQPHPHQQSSSNIRSSTVIRRVEAVITVKREEDGVEGSSGQARSSPTADTIVVKSRNEESQGNTEHSRRRLTTRRGTVFVSDNEQNEIESEENKGIDGGTYKFRKTSRINYHEEDDDEEEEDELMMGAETNRDELYGVHPIESKQQVAVAHPPKKRRKYSMR